MVLKPGGGEVGGHMGATERCVGAVGPAWCAPSPDGGGGGGRGPAEVRWLV